MTLEGWLPDELPVAKFANQDPSASIVWPITPDPDPDSESGSDSELEPDSVPDSSVDSSDFEEFLLHKKRKMLITAY